MGFSSVWQCSYSGFITTEGDICYAAILWDCVLFYEWKRNICPFQRATWKGFQMPGHVKLKGARRRQHPFSSNQETHVCPLCLHTTGALFFSHQRDRLRRSALELEDCCILFPSSLRGRNKRRGGVKPWLLQFVLLQEMCYRRWSDQVALMPERLSKDERPVMAFR